MSRKMPILRVAGPTLVVSLVLFGACTASAIFLYRLHAQTTEELTGDLEGQKLLREIDGRLKVLIDGLKRGKAELTKSHQELFERMHEMEAFADTEEEHELTDQLKASFARYHEEWQAAELLEGQEKKEALARELKILETDTRPLATRLFNSYSKSLQDSERALRGTVKWIAWGLGAVGIIGSLGGMLLGYSVARALRHSIYQLSVRIRDAADRLGQDLPTVTIRSADGIEYLNEQMKHLVHDIDEVVDRLQQREREVLRAEQLSAVGQLAAGVAHELRNPLTSVKMLVQASREDLEAKGLEAEDLQIIEQEIRRLERSLQTFLDFARPPKMERRSLDLGKIINEALVLVSGRAKKQNVELRFAPPSPPVVLEADGDQLRQLFVNLALNAMDAMATAGTMIISMSAVRGEQIEVKVIDTGPGIAPEIKPRLFEPFASGKETGLGLGLVVSRRIAEEHGGTLTADNIARGGACFTLTLPAVKRSPALAV